MSAVMDVVSVGGDAQGVSAGSHVDGGVMCVCCRRCVLPAASDRCGGCAGVAVVVSLVIVCAALWMCTGTMCMSCVCHKCG
jgi:hypothetical protein